MRVLAVCLILSSLLETCVFLTSNDIGTQLKAMAQSMASLQSSMNISNTYMRSLGQKVYEVEKQLFILKTEYKAYGIEYKAHEQKNGEELKKIQGAIKANANRLSGYMKAYKAIGCYVDSDITRDLPGRVQYYAHMTTEVCYDHCKPGGYKYFATQASGHCFCGNTYGAYGVGTGCTWPCAGNPNLFCGGKSRNSVYKLL